MTVPANGGAPDPTRKPRRSHLRWVRLGDCKVSPQAQGQFKPAHADAIAAHFDLEAIGYPVVSIRDGCYWVVDGQHRIQAALIFGFSADDKLQMECYEGLTEADEAKLFLERDMRKAKSAWDKFHVAVTAGWTEEVEIDRIVRLHGMTVTPHRESRGIGAVASLRGAYRALGPPGLATMLRVVDGAYGDSGFEGAVMDGVTTFLRRYMTAVNEEELTARLRVLPGGINGLLQPARKVRLATGSKLTDCVAAEITGAYNRAEKARSKLAPWWRA